MLFCPSEKWAFRRASSSLMSWLVVVKMLKTCKEELLATW